ncbi:MAG: M14 family metallopeptidase [Bryobacterales bacterium]|nr:M14 family metallopeptidase [Bryobacterales bacterium]
MRLRLALAASVAACVFASSAPPSPEAHFGHRMGADRTVLDWDRVVSYFRSLERTSHRIRLRELGKTTEGRPFLAATIASPETLRRLDRYRWIQEKLADPRRTPPEEAEKLIAEGKAVVMITCSIHSTEVASTHTAVEFAWRLLTEDRAKFRRILDEVILLLVPSLNPDGLDLVTRWYRKTLGTPFEGTEPPELYHTYAGHDNNRDWYMFTQQETRLTVAELHNVWRPHIVYDVHQMGREGARMFVPPWTDPIDPNIDPLIVQQCNAFGMGMAADLTAAGKTGVVVNAIYDFWTPARHYQAYHGGLRILSESASVRIASPVVVRPDQIARSGRGYSPRERSWNHLEPWPGGEWRLRDIVDYQSVAWESLLYQAALRREDLLRNFYRIGQRAVARTQPYAFVVPASQRDPGAARKLLETLAFGLVEVERAAEAFTAGGRQFDAGDYVIRMQQPYSAFAKTLLERQRYPDLREYPGGPPRRPYDVTAHTLPLLMGVAAHEVGEPFRARLVRVAEFDGFARPTGRLPASDSDTWRRVNALWKAGAEVWRDPESGDFYEAPGPGRRRVPQPRIALYRSFVPSMDEGWTRWVLEQFGFEYTRAGNREIRAGRLADRFDVVIFPDQPPGTIEEGYKSGTMPEEYCGGLGEEGAAALVEFVRQGGKLIFLNRATEYAQARLPLGVRSATSDLAPREFYSPGSLLNVTLRSGHRLALGLPERIAIWSEQSPAWEAPEDVVVASYPGADILASGWLLGERYLAGRAALLDIPVGRGRVILFGLRPQYRGQSYQTFKLLFNALLDF